MKSGKETRAFVGVCGVCCSECPKYKRGECSGCGPNPVCGLPQCAEQMGVKICFECQKFPCKRFFERGPFKKDWLEFIGSDEVVG